MPRRYRRVRPLRQGDLDRLCGVYAIVNACRAICPELDRFDPPDLFRELLFESWRRQDRGDSTVPADAFGNGLDFAGLRRVAKAMTAVVRRTARILLVTAPLPLRPGMATNLDVMWDELARTLSRSCAIVVGFEGERPHWSAAIGVTARRLEVLDSLHLRTIDKAACSVRCGEAEHVISADGALVIRRKAPLPAGVRGRRR